MNSKAGKEFMISNEKWKNNILLKNMLLMNKGTEIF